jgi:hypothetical protein
MNKIFKPELHLSELENKLPELRYHNFNGKGILTRGDIEWEIEEDEKIYDKNTIIIADKLYPFITKYPEYVKKAFLEMLNEDELYDFNYEKLLAFGNKKYDYILCTEIGRIEDENEIFNYNNIYEYDYAWWNYQRSFAFKDLEKISKYEFGADIEAIEIDVQKQLGFIKRDYFEQFDIYLTGDWFRMIKNDKLLYFNILSLKWHIFYQLEEYIEKLYEESENIKKYTDNSNKLLSIIEEILSIDYSKLDGKIYEMQEGTDADYIFFNNSSTKKVSFLNFQNDIDDNKSDYKEVIEIIERIKIKVKSEIF